VILLVTVGACFHDWDKLRPLPDADADVDVAVDTDVDEDEAGDESLTFIVTSASMLSDGLCDLDGDGTEDNAIRQLGWWAGSFAHGVNEQTNFAIDRGELRIVAHVLGIEDLPVGTDADVVLILSEAADTDEPPDREDDFSGDEPFFILGRSLDGCGEPLYHYRCSIERGVLDAPEGTGVWVRGTDVLPLIDGRASGTIGMGELDVSICGTIQIQSIGAAGMATGDHSLLEWFIAGARLVWPSLDLVQPDIDLDDDELEQFAFDADEHLERCVDGDGTEILGRDCWEDARMADGFSTVVRIEAVPALFGGLHPYWEDQTEGSCDGGPPDPSLWDSP
jgi:hypothetical protein